MKPTKREIKILFAVSLMTLTIIAIVYAWQETYRMKAKVAGVALGVFSDSECTTRLLKTEEKDWGEIYSGDKKSIWIKNEGTEDVHITLTVTALGCEISTSPQIFPLDVGGLEQIDLTITTSEPVGKEISWELTITATPLGA